MRESRDERKLRAKYLDWCSARIAERIERMSADEMFALAENVQAPPTESVGAPVVGSGTDYPELLKKLTLHVAGELDLPDFGVWLERYRRDPRAFEQELLGFTLGEPPEGGAG